MLLVVFNIGCFSVEKQLTILASVDEKDDTNNIATWVVSGYTIVGDASRYLDDKTYHITWSIIDEDSKTVWSGNAAVLNESTTPDEMSVVYIDTNEDSKISSGDSIIVKVSSDGFYKVKAVYNGKTAWESDLEKI
jgi:hypothetical protein